MKKNGKRITAWLMACIMVWSLVMVPAGKVEAAETGTTETYDLLNGNAITETGTVEKDPYGTDSFCEHQFGNLDQTLLSNLGSYSSLTFEAEVTVNNSSNGNPTVVGYAMDAAYGNWKDDGHAITAIPQTQKISLDLTSYKTLSRVGIRFTQCSIGTTINYTIQSAKIIGVKSSGSSSGGEESGGETSGDVTATVSKKSGNADWAEYNYTVTNGTDSPISGIQIKVPYSGTVNNLQSWNCSATTSGNYIVISHTAVLKAGGTYSCVGSDTIKFGFAGGATLGDPVVEFVYGEDGGGTSSSELKYELTGQVKTVAQADTPVGKHGALNLAQVDGYSAPIIVDQNGQPFQLRGASTHGMHWDAMHPYVNKGSFQSLRDEWGVNMVRLVSYVTQDGYTKGSQSLLDAKIQEGVQAATDLGMYAIVDWHIHEEDPNTTKSNAEEFFKKYATMYKDYDNVIFEICNEPTGVQWYNGSGNDLYSYCRDIAQIIRDCGSNALIVCGTNTWSQDVDDVAKKPLKDDGFENILYTFHFYSGSHYADKMQKVKTATAAGTPIFVTEFGICDASGNGGYDTANADTWIKLLDEYNISYACWSLCNKNESASYLLPSCTKTTGGWVESDLSTTGKWLVNTYRAHEDAENGKDTSVGDFSISVDPEKGVLDSVSEGYTDPGKATITIKNTSEKELTNLSAKLAVGKNFAISKDLESTTLTAGESTTVEVSLLDGKTAGTYADTITIQSGTIKKIQNVKQVVTKVEEVVAVTGVTLSSTESTLEIGATETLKATVTPADATNKKVTWSSSDEKVATVDAKGIVTAVAAGKTTITVTTEDGNKTATCEVTVTKPDPVQTEIIGEDTIDVKVGDTLSKVDISSYVVKAGTDNVTEQGVLSWKEADKTFAAADDGAQYTLVFTPKDAEAYIATEKKITFHVTKLANTKKPVAPTVESKTDASVTLAVYEGTETVEYGKLAGDKYVWQTAPTFEGLSPYTAYTFAMRFAETEEMTAGEAGDGTKAITYLAEKDRYTVDVSLVNDADYVGAHAGTITYDEESKTLTLEEDKEYTLTGSNPDVKVIAKNKDLILKDATIKGIEAKGDRNLRLSGDNTVKNAGIISEGTITIEDEGNSSVVGKLDVEGDNFGAIVADTVIIKSGQITATGTGDAVAIKAATKIELVGGMLVANADKQPVICAGDGTEENPGEIILDGCQVSSQADTIYNVTPKDSQGNVVEECKVTYQDVEDGKYSVKKGSNIQLINVPVKKGSHVKGWQAAGTDEVLAPGTEVEVTADITFIPVYEEITGALVLTPDASAAPLTEGYEADAGVTVTIENGTNVDWDAVTFALDNSNFVLDTTEVDSFKQGAKKTLHVMLKEGMKAADYETTLTVSVKPEGEMEPQHVVIKRTVQAKQEEIKKVSKIVVSLDQTKVELAAEDGATATVKATATITPTDAKDQSVKWSVGNTDVATVDTKGVITAKAAGVVKITATAQDGSNVSGSAILTITKKEKEDSGKTDPTTPSDPGKDDPGKGDSGKGDSGKQDPNTDKPSTGNNQTPANKPNTTGETDEVKATAIQVTADVKKAEDLLATGTMKLAPKKKMQLNVAFLPEDADEEELTFTSSNPKIATVDEDGEIVAGKKVGKTTITVRSASGLTKTFQIQVMKKAVSKVKLQTKTKNLKVGKTLKIKATTLPSKKYASSTILWMSNNENIATVSPKGVVKGLKAGKVKITAVATDGSGKKATVTIKVK